MQPAPYVNGQLFEYTKSTNVYPPSIVAATQQYSVYPNLTQVGYTPNNYHPSSLRQQQLAMTHQQGYNNGAASAIALCCCLKLCCCFA